MLTYDRETHLGIKDLLTKLYDVRRQLKSSEEYMKLNNIIGEYQDLDFHYRLAKKQPTKKPKAYNRIMEELTYLTRKNSNRFKQ